LIVDFVFVFAFVALIFTCHQACILCCMVQYTVSNSWIRWYLLKTLIWFWRDGLVWYGNCFEHEHFSLIFLSHYHHLRGNTLSSLNCTLCNWALKKSTDFVLLHHSTNIHDVSFRQDFSVANITVEASSSQGIDETDECYLSWSIELLWSMDGKFYTMDSKQICKLWSIYFTSKLVDEKQPSWCWSHRQRNQFIDSV
jgi:hypothetical protein